MMKKIFSDLKKFVLEYKHIILIFVLIFIIAFSLRLFPIRISNWWDETVYLQHAEVFFSGRTNYDELSFRPPLLSILFYITYFIWHHIFAVSILVAFINTLTPVFIFLIGKKLYSNRVGVIAGLLSAFVPFIVRNSNYLLTDGPVITFMAIAFYFSLYKDKNIYLFLSGVFCSLAILMKFTAVLLVPIIFLFLLLNQVKIKRLLIFIFGVLLVLTPYFIWMQLIYGDFLIPFKIGPSFVADKNEPTLFYFYKFSETFTELAVIGLILWVLRFGYLVKKRNWSKIKVEVILLLWIILFFFYMTKTNHKELRYILPITVPLMLMVGNGLDFVFNLIKKQWIIYLWIIFIIYLIFLSYPRIQYIKEVGLVDKYVSDEMIIADYLNNEMNYTGIIYTNQRWPVFAYYTGLKTIQVYPYDERIYELIPEKMPKKGIWIGQYSAERFTPFKQPTFNRLLDDKRFKFNKDIGDFYIFEYNSN